MVWTHFRYHKQPDVRQVGIWLDWARGAACGIKNGMLQYIVCQQESALGSLRHMKYRVAFDLGANSLGWWTYELDADGNPFRSIEGGVRIFADGRDPQSGKSLAEDRRLARGMRRRRDRYINRRKALMNTLIRAGLMPRDEASRKALEKLDPYDLRVRALDEKLPLHHLGRALFHLNQRRGFKSNRKTDARDNEAGKIRTGIARLEQAMLAESARTYGEFLHKRLQAGLGTRTRLRPETGEKARGEGYDFYPSRKLLEEEFDKVWQAQSAYHPDVLGDDLRERLRRIIFGQRPLKPPRVGRCLYVPEEERLAKAHPLFQELRLYQEVNHLTIIEPNGHKRPLTLEERDKLILALRGARKKTFSALRKLLKLPAGARFNKESETRKDIPGNEVHAQLSHKQAFGARWSGFGLDEQWRIVQRLLNEENPERLRAWLKDEHGLGDEQVAHIDEKVSLPKGFGRLGFTASRRILDELKADVIPYSEAVKRAGFNSHSEFATGEVFDELPYYGHILQQHIPPGTGNPDDPEEIRVGRITNPTVHIGLNQLRRVLNALIRRHGKPAEIIIELARELKMSEQQKQAYNKRLAENTRAAQARSQRLEELGIEDNGRNRLMLRLWEELSGEGDIRTCVYTGKPIGIRMLFSGEVDIDHILPYSRTLDDSPANKIVCLREANRRKRNRSPWEAWGETPQWEDILARAQRLPANKRWRFLPDAMERFQDDGGFLARQLMETQYLSRMARLYLAALYPVRLSEAPVWVTPGRLTEMLRRRWGLNSLLHDHNQYDTDKPKNRQDHRHHAIDAAVIGLADRGLINRISRAAGQMEQQGLEDFVWQSVPEQPWEGFRQELIDILQRMVVSHRPRRKSIDFRLRALGRDQTAAQLHNDTAYGLTGETNEKGHPLVVHRVPLESLKKPADIHKICDEQLRELLWEETRDLSGKDFQQALITFASKEKINGKRNPFHGLRRVRIIEALSTIPIRDRRTGKPYKGYKGDANYCFEVWELPNGKWAAVVISMFDAHQPETWRNFEQRKPHPAARRLMRIFRNDMCAYEIDGQHVIGRVQKFDQSGNIYLCPHNEANVDARVRAGQMKFVKKSANALRGIKFRLVHVDEIGQVRDPGPFD